MTSPFDQASMPGVAAPPLVPEPTAAMEADKQAFKDSADPHTRFSRVLNGLVRSVATSWRCEKRRRFLYEYFQTRRIYAGPMADTNTWTFPVAPGFENPSTATPLNVLNQTASSLVANILHSDPDVEPSSRRTPQYRAFADMVAARMKWLLWKSRYVEQERLCFLDALMGCGVMVVGEHAAGVEFEFNGKTYQPGETYACRVSPVDWLISVNARDREETEYEGHRYRTTADRLVSVLEPEEIDRLPKYSQRSDPERHSKNEADDNFVQFYDLMDLYIPPRVLSREGLVLTLAGDPAHMEAISSADSVLNVIRVREYDGPDGGPYEVYGFNRVQDSPYYAAPLVVVRDIAEMVGDLSRHNMMSDQTAADIILHRDDASPEEADAVRTAKHLTMVAVKDETAYKQVTRGGSTEQSHRSLQTHLQLYGMVSGSGILSANGISKTSGDTTATEAEEASSRLNVILSGLERVVYDHGDRVLDKMKWYELRSPYLNQMVNLKISGVDQVMMLNAQTVSAYDLADSEVVMRRGSMRRVDDQIRAKKTMEWASMAPMMGAQIKQLFGDGFDLVKFLKVTSRGVLDPADVDSILPNPESLISGMLQAGNTAHEATPRPGAPVGRRPGTPGSPAIEGSSRTGNRSTSFDLSGVRGNTMEAVRS